MRVASYLVIIFLVVFASSSQAQDAKTMSPDGKAAADSVGLISSESNQQESIEQLQAQLQFIEKALNKQIEVSSPYDFKLGELYYGYAQLLSQLKRYSDAVTAYKSALQINKIENGVYSPSQRNILIKVVEAYIQQNQISEATAFMDHVLWIEGKDDGLNDELSYQALVDLGNAMIDFYLSDAVLMEVEKALQLLHKARDYFTVALFKAEDKLLRDQLLPYGELALIAFLESSVLKSGVNNASVLSGSRSVSNNVGGLTRRGGDISNLERQREIDKINRLMSTYPRAIKIIEKYLQQAIKEQDLEHIVQAQLSLGDINSLFSRTNKAQTHYQKAWQAAQGLPPEHTLHKELKTPKPLPHFYYAGDRQPDRNTQEYVPIDTIVSIRPSGHTYKIQIAPTVGAELAAYKRSAKRKVNRLQFRPKIIQGKPVITKDFKHTVYLKKRNSKAKTQPQSKQKQPKQNKKGDKHD